MQKSRIHIQPALPSHETLWDDYVLNHPRGIGYQLFAWKKTMEAAYHLKTEYLMAESGNSIVGVLPLAVIKAPFLSPSLVSLPYCDAAGPLADNEDTQKKLLQAAANIKDFSQKASQNIPVQDIRGIDPFAGIPPEAIAHEEKVRMIMELPESSQQLWTSLKSKVRSQVRKAEKNGLVARMGKQSLLNDFYGIFCENMRDLGSLPHGFSWFSCLVRFMKDQVRICVVYTRDGVPAAAGLIICHPNVVSIPWASSLRKYNRTNANMLLYWTLLKFCADRQYPVFDFGRSTRGEGTFRFKRQWGASPAPLYWAEFQGRHLKTPSPSSKTGRQPRLLAEQILSRLPIRVSKILGTQTRKYISL